MTNNNNGSNRDVVITIIILTYVAIVLLIFGFHLVGVPTLEEDKNGIWIDVKNWVAMTVTLVVPIGIALLIWKYSDIQTEKIRKMLGVQEQRVQEKEKDAIIRIRMWFAQSRKMLIHADNRHKQKTDDFIQNQKIDVQISQHLRTVLGFLANIDESDIDKILVQKNINEIRRVKALCYSYCEMALTEFYPAEKWEIINDIDNLLTQLPNPVQ